MVQDLGGTYFLSRKVGRLKPWKGKTLIAWGLPDQKMSHSLTPSRGLQLILIAIYSLEAPENFQANFPKSLLLCPTL
jgi:hypothetical protein